MYDLKCAICGEKAQFRCRHTGELLCPKHVSLEIAAATPPSMGNAAIEAARPQDYTRPSTSTSEMASRSPTSFLVRSCVTTEKRKQGLPVFQYETRYDWNASSRALTDPLSLNSLISMPCPFLARGRCGCT